MKQYNKEDFLNHIITYETDKIVNNLKEPFFIINLSKLIYDLEIDLNKCKIKINNIKLDIEFIENKESIKSKEEWKELGITNAEGRKSFIQSKTKVMRTELNKVESHSILLMNRIKLCKRLYNISMEFIKE